jgi:RimJ/RimL family protein N-acetyltransferase
VELREVARGGIHPPGFMPFFRPWTDAADDEDFVVAFHEAARDDWTPDRWNLMLGVWAGGRLIGSQGAESADWLATRTAETGSWLGQAWQGRGYGTEMRTAVVELLWALGARAVTSGAVEGNAASARVSEKLGYRVAGELEIAPRGTPVRETLYRLEPAYWTPACAVELEGVEAALPLFSAAR